jgi:hypothetical protein
MGLILKQPGKPKWVALHSGAALLCGPGTSLQFYAARSRAEALVIDLKAAGSAVTKAGGRIEGVPDLSSVEAVASVVETLLIVSLAELLVCDWRGIFDKAKGAAIPFQPAYLAQLLLDHTVAEKFREHCLTPLHEVSAEKNG